MMFDTDRQISNHSHPTMEVGHQDALASIDQLASVMGLHVEVLPVPVEADAPDSRPVEDVLSFGNATKVSDAIVGLVAVDVVKDAVRVLSVIQEPRNAVGKEVAPIDGKCGVSGWPQAPSFFAGSLAENYSGVRVIGEKIVSNLWNRFNASSHVESPLNVVRGLVTAITSTPILSQGVAA